MEVQESLNSLNESSKELENIFTNLTEWFSKLSKKQDSNSIDKLKDIFTQLEQLHRNQIEIEKDFFSELNLNHSNFNTSLAFSVFNI